MNLIFNIYHALFCTNKIFSNNKQILRIRCLIISFSITEYFYFRRLFHINIKNKERLSKSFNKFTFKKKSAMKKKFAVKKKFAMKKKSAVKKKINVKY